MERTESRQATTNIRGSSLAVAPEQAEQLLGLAVLIAGGQQRCRRESVQAAVAQVKRPIQEANGGSSGSFSRPPLPAHHS
jgi:hypothetical protein